MNLTYFGNFINRPANTDTGTKEKRYFIEPRIANRTGPNGRIHWVFAVFLNLGTLVINVS